MTGLLRRLATAIFTSLPYQVADRVHPWRRRMYRDTPVTSARPARCTLLIGPVNSAGQGYAWARAAERLPGVSAVDLMFRSPSDRFLFPADHSVSARVAYGVRRWQDAEREAILRSFTHVIVESGLRLFDTHAPVLQHLQKMTGAGASVALLFHGSDIRSPSGHAQHDPDSPFIGDRYEGTARLERITRDNRALIDAARLPVFVSTPDLLAVVPEATWLPVVVEPMRWQAAAAEALRGSRPVVVHAPSRAGLKGSALIDPVVRRLHDEGVIEYREVHDVASDEMPAVYGSSDVVLDQFSLGIYGVAACEAMASGRLVISHVSETVRREVRDRTGQELPILQSRAHELEQVLRDVAARPDHYRDVAAAGVGFVQSVHDGRRSAEALADFLDRSGE